MKYLKKFNSINESLVRDNNFNSLSNKLKCFLNEFDSIVNDVEDEYEEDYGGISLSYVEELVFHYMDKHNIHKSDLDDIKNANVDLGNLEFYFERIYDYEVEKESRDSDKLVEISNIKHAIEDIINNNNPSTAADMIYTYIKKDYIKRGYML